MLDLRAMSARVWRRRALSWSLAILALSFVAWVVPVRDRCRDPGTSATPSVAISRLADVCIVHVSSGDIPISRRDCEALKCEPGLASALVGTKIGVLVALLGLYGVGTLIWAARWRLLLSLGGVDLSLSRVWRISIEAQAGGILLPGGLGGDAFRIAAVSGASRADKAPPLSIAIASILLDRMIGLSTIAAVAGAIGLALGGPNVGTIAWGLLCIPLGFCGSLLLLRSRILSGETAPMRGRIGQRLRPLVEYVRHPDALRVVAKACIVSLLVSASQIAVIRGLVFALGASPSQEKWVYVGTAMAFIVSALPALPGGWGTADAAYVFFLGFAGIGAGTALAVCLLYRLFWYVSGAVGALLHLLPGGAFDETSKPTVIQ